MHSTLGVTNRIPLTQEVSVTYMTVAQLEVGRGEYPDVIALRELGIGECLLDPEKPCTHKVSVLVSQKVCFSFLLHKALMREQMSGDENAILDVVPHLLQTNQSSRWNPTKSLDPNSRSGSKLHLSAPKRSNFISKAS
ncbi:hypothetical protein KIL84_017335 [Mauremys mutica]|uniref:Uncharacterized protein n=1 Tax=Mauremys mutica TaxID=74926 RepID=A0A9D3X556_9SAUR|nr:hypothetical protein KIL84_017335 [Mauremys mutica]